MFWSLALLWSACNLGEMLTKHFEMFDDALGQCDWYLFSIEIQRMLVIIMSNSQRPAILTGYGNIQCTRETFKKVLETIPFPWRNCRNQN